MFVDCLCSIFTAAENCVKVENEEFIQLSNDYNPCDGTNNKVSFRQPQNEFPRTSEMAESCHVKKMLTSDSVEPNKNDTVVNNHHLIGPGTSQGSSGTGIRENIPDEVPQLTSYTVEPNKNDIVVNNHHLIGPTTSRGSSGTGIGESTVGEIQEISHNADDDRRHQCKVCGLMLKTKKNLKKHMGIHTGEKPYNCSFCDKKFLDKYYRNIHELWHKGELPQCPVCGGRYTNLHKHMLTHDDSADRYKHICSVCKKGFRTVPYLKSHMLMHSKEKPYTCQDCGGRFRCLSSLKSHMLTHTKEKNHVCSVCGSSFAQKYGLVAHKRVHTGERPYSCETCGKAFKQKSSLELHQATHTSEKHFTCDTCGKQFPRYTSLQRHSLIHSGVQPYECSVCGMKFNQSNSMQRHMLIHTGEKPYSCSDCGERFRQSSCLASHRRRQCAKNKQK